MTRTRKALPLLSISFVFLSGCPLFPLFPQTKTGGGGGSGGSDRYSIRDANDKYTSFTRFHKAAVEKSNPFPSDAKTWTLAARFWAETCLAANALLYKKRGGSKKMYCEHIGKCAEGEASKKKAYSEWTAFVKASLAKVSTGDSFPTQDAVGGAVVTLQRPTPLRKSLPFDQWIGKIGAAKTTRWKNRVKKVGGFDEHVRRTGKGICFTSRGKTKGAKDVSKLAYHFGRDEEIHIRCVLPQKISGYQRAKKDYFNFKFYAGDDYDKDRNYKTFKLWKDVGTSPASNTIEISLPAEVFSNKYKANAKKYHAETPGDWLQIRASYVVPKDTGRVREVWRGRMRSFVKVIDDNSYADVLFYVKIKSPWGE